MQKNSGFTLIELLVVIAIIGILASIVLTSLNGTRAKGRDAKRISDIKQFQLALELYYDANQNFPTDAQAPLTAGASNPLTSNGYLSVIPTDPGTGAYGYRALPSGCGTTTCTSYLIAAILESGSTALSGSYTGDPTNSFTVNGGSVKCDGSNALLFCAKP